MDQTVLIWPMSVKPCVNKLIEWKKLGKNTSQAEHTHQKCECEQQKQKEQNELHKIIMKRSINWCRKCLSNYINVIIRMMILIWMNLTN
jgi:hypothetical protein